MSVGNETFNTQLNSTNQLLGRILGAISSITTALDTVAIIPAPTYGAVGTYLLAKCSAAVAAGATTAGSTLTPSDASGTATGASPAGVWMAMGATSAANQVSLFVRAS